MASYQVIGVRITRRPGSAEQITHIAYEGSLFNPKVIITVDEAIARIASNKAEFYIKSLKQPSFLTVVEWPESKPCIQSVPVKGKDYLLGLQRC